MAKKEKEAQSEKEILLLIDSYALIHRAFHAFKTDLTTSQGEVVNAVYGFARLLLEVLTKFKPKYVVAAMDSAGPTLRHNDYGQYKANRKPSDPTLHDQVPRIIELLTTLNIPVLMHQGYEADDIIGTLDLNHSGPGNHTIIVTGDRDLFQLVDEDTSVYMAGTAFSQSKLYTPADVEERMGVTPAQIIDLKAIQGDASDNIPGVAGIGEKGALTLLQEFKTLDEIYLNIDKVAPRYQEKLKASVEMAYKSRSLATIMRDAPIPFDLADAEFGNFDADEVGKFFQQLEFRSLLTKPLQLKAMYGGDQVKAAELTEDLTWPTDLSIYKDEKLENEIAVCFKADTSGDPTTWQIQEVHVKSGEQAFTITENLAKSLESALKGVELIITSDSKAFIHGLRNLGVSYAGRVWDVVLTEYILSAGASQQTINSSLAVAGIATIKIFDALPELYQSQLERLKNEPALSRIVELENNLTPVIMEMEQVGITLDVALMKDYTEKLDELIKKKEEQIYYHVGHEFNIGSPKQVGQILFEELSLPGQRKTKTGSYSTDERTLKEISHAHPVIDLILQYRELTKLQSTYVKPLPGLVNNNTGRIHTNYRQMGAVTGRFASLNPNLQNIPLGEVEGINMRKAFTAAEGKTLIAFDYSQQELRLLAEFAAEETMLQAFTSGQDIHATTASEMFEVPIDQVTKEQRKIGKTINFGVVYGISAFGLADRLKIDNRKASEFIKKYFETYPKIKQYYNNLLEQSRLQGYVATLMGRRRSTRDLASSNVHLRQAAEREILNFPLQGSAADIIKAAMLEMPPIIEKYPVKLLLQVHDELVFEYDCSIGEVVKNSDVEKFITDVKKQMLEVVSTKVPFAVGIEYGQNWAEMQEWSE